MLVQMQLDNKLQLYLDGDYYILNGTKIFITNGGQSDTYIIFAMTDKSKGTRGISAFIVEKDYPGFSIGKIEEKDGVLGDLQLLQINIPKL